MKIIEREERIIAVDHTNGYYIYRIPGILAVRGALLMVYEARALAAKVGGSDWGDIDIHVLRMETGKEPELVLKIGESSLPGDGGMRTYNNPVLIPDGDNVHLIYHRNYEEAFLLTSEDGGKSWSEACEITESYRGFPFEWNSSTTGPGHGIQLKSGRLVAPVWMARGEIRADGSRAFSVPMSGCLYSDDHGGSWHAGMLAEDVFGGNETCVEELADGRLLFNHRNRNADKNRVLSISSDEGLTLDKVWSEEELSDPQCMGGMTRCREGILFANCNSKVSRTDLMVKLLADADTHWDVVWEVDPISGYADIAASGDEVFVFYERFDRDKKELVLKTGEIL